MISGNGKYGECYAANIEMVFDIMTEVTQDTQQLVGHINNGRMYLSVQDKENEVLEIPTPNG